MHYQTYGLTLDSQLALPELQLADPAQAADITLRIAHVAPDGLPNGKQLGPFLWTTPTALWLEVPRVARYLVENGNSITVQPLPGIDDESVRLFLLGSALGGLLFQRGHLVLHGNAIRIGDACLVCVGSSGAGKSTLAAGFWQRGYDVLADDIIPIDNDGKAIPGFPRIKLWQDVAHQLDIDTQALQSIRPGIQKYLQPVSAAEHPLPIRWIYVLGQEHIDHVQLTPIQGHDRFISLYKNTYRRRYLSGMSLGAEHLKLCGQLAQQARLAKITRPREGFHLDHMVTSIINDIAAHP